MSFDVTLDQARALDAFARGGTFARAAELLGKQHSAVLYAIRNLEAVTGLTLLDRRGYRSRLTPEGQRVLELSRRLLVAASDLETASHTIRTGWEPHLTIVFDGIYPSGALLRHVNLVLGGGGPARVVVHSEVLAGVEAAFLREHGDLMISVLPPVDPRVVARPLAPLRAFLVAHASHPLGRATRVTPEDLAGHVLLDVRGSDPRLLLSTSALDQRRLVHLNDFHSKKEAILSGMGFGWLPGYLVGKELRSGKLRKIAWREGNTHVFRPHVCFHRDRTLGRAAAAIAASLEGERGLTRA